MLRLSDFFKFLCGVREGLKSWAEKVAIKLGFCPVRGVPRANFGKD